MKNYSRGFWWGLSRFLVGFGLGTILTILVTALTAHAQEDRIYTVEDTLAALDGAPYPIDCIVGIETGHTYYPYSEGALGEQGVIQLLPSWAGGGQWNEFFYGDWTPLSPEQRSTWNPYQEIAYLEHWGRTHNWTFWPWSAARYC